MNIFIYVILNILQLIKILNNFMLNDSKNLIDPFGRAVTYLRISVTDRCDFRCVYCMSENMTFLPKKDLLSLEELELVCKTFMSMGVSKIRLTGGEPTVRKDFFDILKDMKQNSNIPKITMTTNGYRLNKIAKQ